MRVSLQVTLLYALEVRRVLRSRAPACLAHLAAGESPAVRVNKVDQQAVINRAVRYATLGNGYHPEHRIIAKGFSLEITATLLILRTDRCNR